MSIDTSIVTWPRQTHEARPTPFGDVLAKLRIQRGLSMSRLGLAAGTNYSHVSRLEGGSRQPSRPTVIALADALDATDAERHELMNSAGFAMDDDDDVRAFRALPPAARKALLRMVDVVRGEVT